MHPIFTASTGAGASADGRTVTADEAYLRDSHPVARQGHRGRLSADHAELFQAL